MWIDLVDRQGKLLFHVDVSGFLVPRTGEHLDLRGASYRVLKVTHSYANPHPDSESAKFPNHLWYTGSPVLTIVPEREL